MSVATEQTRRSRRALRLASWLLALAMVNVAAAEMRSPFDESTAVQQQLRLVANRSSRSVFAVTAFTEPPVDRALYAAQLAGSTFAALAEQRARSCGSAFAIDGNGHLVTNEHVVSGAASVWVTDDSGRVIPAVVVGTDPRTDLAVLSIGIETAAISVADAPPQRGDLIVAVGNPDGLATDGNLAASAGCVSAIGRSLPTLSARERRSYADLLQVTTPIGVGGSGGPLLDLSGRAVGIVSAVATADRDDLPVGFAIALSPTIRERINRLIRGEEVLHPYFGISVSAIANVTKDSPTLGAHIDRVESDAPSAGILREGDVVISVAGRPVSSDRAFVALAAACPVEADVPLQIRRDGTLVDVSVRPARRALPAEPITRATQQFNWGGVTFVNVQGGVRVTAIARDATMPLEIGAVVHRVDGESVPDVARLAALLFERAGQAVSLDVAKPE